MTKEERKLIAVLEAEIALLKQMQREYNLMLNYIVLTHGIIPEGEDDAVYYVPATRIRTIDIRPIRTEITKDGTVLEIRRLPPEKTQNNGS